MKLRSIALVLTLSASSLAWGDALDVPERVARLSYVEGEVAFQGAAELLPSALPDRPLMPGDRLTTGRDGRAELAFGTAVIRLDQGTQLSLVVLDAATIRVELAAGTAGVHLYDLLDDETFEIVTRNATIAFQEPGEYRVDVAADGATEFTVRTGAAELATAGGPVRVADGQRVRLEGRDALAGLAPPRPTDAFDDWVLEREVQFAQSEPPLGERSDGYEDEMLARYGEWYEEPSYGRVWMPSYAYGGRDPFHHGRWQRTGFGWSWFDPMPWSGHTLHYGRWAYLRHMNRWCWVPARRDHRRHFAHGERPRHDRRDPRPDNRARRDDDDRRPAATPTSLPRRIDADRRPVFRPDVGSTKPQQGGTVAPSSNSTPDPPPRSTPPPPSGETTMRPSRPENSNNNREFGTRQTP